MNTIPFQFTEIYAGLAESEGLLSLSPEALVLEFQIKDAIVGALKSKVKRIELRFADIDEVQLHTNVLGTSLTVVVDSLQLVEDVPNVKQGRFKVKVPRSHRKEAAALAREASIRVSELRLDRLDNTLDRTMTCAGDT